MKSSNSEPQPNRRRDDERRPEGRGPVFIGYNEEFDSKLRESAKRDLIESSLLQDTLMKIYRGEFDKLRPKDQSQREADREEPGAKAKGNSDDKQ
jgi:hypothetical protein